ncbi:MAG TPA: hypothetical protein VHO01_01310 [Jatrophihabitans sp.]|nr:hypothetical protein [Jatrophihabitans sp.]
MAAPAGRRSALPALLVTMVLLLAVLATLLLTGQHHRTPAGFGLTLDTPVVAVTAGDTITTTITIRADRSFHGEIRLSAAGLPAGLVAEFEPPTVTVTDAEPAATVQLRLHTTQVLPAGPVGISVVASAGQLSRTSVVQLQVQPDGGLSTAPNPAPAPSEVGFTLAGRPAGQLAPGLSLPIDVQLDNSGSTALTVSSIVVTAAGTSRAGCGLDNFTVTQYTGRYPLRLAARSDNTLSSLGIPRASWPKLTMLNLPVNQDGCKGVIVRLRFAGSGAGT